MAQQNIFKGHLKASRPINCVTHSSGIWPHNSLLTDWMHGGVSVCCVLVIKRKRERDRLTVYKVWLYLRGWLYLLCIVTSEFIQGIFSIATRFSKKVRKHGRESYSHLGCIDRSITDQTSDLYVSCQVRGLYSQKKTTFRKSFFFQLQFWAVVNS